MEISQPLDEFQRNAPEFLRRLKESGDPMVLTVDGAEFVVQDAESYRRLADLAEQMETQEAIRRGFEDIRAGRTQPSSEVIEELRKEFNISQELWDEEV